MGREGKGDHPAMTDWLSDLDWFGRAVVGAAVALYFWFPIAVLRRLDEIRDVLQVISRRQK